VSEVKLLWGHDQTKKLGTITIENKDVINLMASDSVFFDPCFLKKEDGSVELVEVSLCVKQTPHEDTGDDDGT